MCSVTGPWTVSRSMRDRSGSVELEDRYQAAEEGIRRTESFFHEIGLPSTLSEVGIGPEHFQEMAEKAVEVSGIAARSYYHLDAEDIVKIFESCLG